MATTAKQFAKFQKSLMNKEIDLDSDIIKVALFTAAHAPDQAVDQYYDAANGMTEVAAGNGYAAGGVALSGLSIATAALITTFDAADPSWAVTGAGFTYRYAVIYDATPSSNKPLICYIDFGADVVAAAGTHTITLDALGIARNTVA